LKQNSESTYHNFKAIFESPYLHFSWSEKNQSKLYRK